MGFATAALLAFQDLSPARAEAPLLRGRVVDASGAPAPGVRIVLGEIGHATLFYNSPTGTSVATPGVPDGERARYALERVSDAEGRFSADGLARGDYSVLATDERRGIGLVSVSLREPGASDLEVRLQAPTFVDAEIRGLAFDPSRDLVELVPLSNGSNVQFHPQLALAPGSWSFRSTALPPLSGWRVLGTEVVLAQDYRATLFVEPVHPKPGDHGKVTLDFPRAPGIVGNVVDGEGKPLSGVSIVARPLDGEGIERGAVSDAGGRYAIAGLSPGKHTLEALRWKLRTVGGCGNGAQDVAARLEILLPLADAKQADFRIDELLPVPRVGDAAPRFDARTLDGRALALGDLRGKVVLLDFWATWCGSCRLELPSLLAAYDELGRGGRFEIVGVSVDADLELVPRFVASRGMRWPQTALGPAATNPIARLFNVNSTPATVLVDAQGKIAALNLLGEPLRRKIAELLAER